jgi:hypothetical protein
VRLRALALHTYKHMFHDLLTKIKDGLHHYHWTWAIQLARGET